MSDDEWQSGICNDKSGFLFSHACQRPPTETCSICDKPICDDHTQVVGEQTLCKSCVKVDLKRRGRGGNERRYGDSDYDDYDPYFYGGYYYNGYGYYGRGYWGHDSYHRSIHDSNDFTEADGESLSYEGDEDFENDMGES